MKWKSDEDGGGDRLKSKYNGKERQRTSAAIVAQPRKVMLTDLCP